MGKLDRSGACERGDPTPRIRPGRAISLETITRCLQKLHSYRLAATSGIVTVHPVDMLGPCVVHYGSSRILLTHPVHILFAYQVVPPFQISLSLIGATLVLCMMVIAS